MPFVKGQTGNPAGRPRGVRDKRLVARDEALAVVMARLAHTPDGAPVDAHTLLVRVYNEPTMPIEMRVAAARAALKVERPALLATNITGDVGLHISVADQLARARRREISGPPIIDASASSVATTEIAA